MFNKHIRGKGCIKEFCVHRFLVGLVITMQRSWNNSFMYTDNWDFTGTQWKPHNRESQLLCWECTGVHFHDFNSSSLDWKKMYTENYFIPIYYIFEKQLHSGFYVRHSLFLAGRSCFSRLVKRATGTINVSNQQSRSEGIRFAIK